MPIEIRELHIKVKIEEEAVAFQASQGMGRQEIEALKSSIIRECTNKVLEKIKEKEER